MKKILIVDDEQISLMMANHILATEYQTVCASSGREAIALYESERPDMVLSDLNMPNISGYELQKMMEEQFKTSIPFMFMTAEKDEVHDTKGFEQGALDFIRKPFRADVLLKRVGNILNTIDKIQGLSRAAFTDPMTGLLNKVSSQEEIDVLCRHTPGAFMMVDLDSFKPVNDIYGHDMGDKILIRFAEILRSAVRTSDIAGRIGGDEFVAYCQNVTVEEVIAEKAKYINEQIIASAKEFMGEDMAIPIGASIGCAFSPKEGTDYKTLYLKADKALYNVKQNGKHGYEVYRTVPDSERKDVQKSGNLAQMFTILSERNPAKGAYVLPDEQFRTTYRFLSRYKANYNRDFWILMMTVKSESKDEAELADAADEFGKILGGCLRQSDVVTKSSKNQFLVLLMETNRSNIKVIIERIQKKWEQNDFGKSCGFEYELDAIR